MHNLNIIDDNFSPILINNLIQLENDFDILSETSKTSETSEISQSTESLLNYVYNINNYKCNNDNISVMSDDSDIFINSDISDSDISDISELSETDNNDDNNIFNIIKNNNSDQNVLVDFLSTKFDLPKIIVTDLISELNSISKTDHDVISVMNMIYNLKNNNDDIKLI